jgi:hypothetical protein
MMTPMRGPESMNLLVLGARESGLAVEIGEIDAVRDGNGGGI